VKGHPGLLSVTVPVGKGEEVAFKPAEGRPLRGVGEPAPANVVDRETAGRTPTQRPPGSERGAGLTADAPSCARTDGRTAPRRYAGMTALIDARTISSTRSICCSVMTSGGEKKICSENVPPGTG
jgi:hypothetical protein